MASIGDTTRPAFAYDQATDTWVPVGIGPHSHTAAGVGAVATSSFAAKGDLLVGTGAGTLVAQTVGTDGQVLTADSTQADGVKWAAPASGTTTWTQRLSPATLSTSTVTAIGFNGSNLYAIGTQNGGLYTSPDAITWTSRTSGFGSSQISSIIYGNSLWVAVGDSGLISTSPDGVTWTVRTSGVSTNQLNSVIYENSLFVAVGAGANGGTGGITTSTDGLTWTKRTTPTTSSATLLSVAYGNGYFVAVGNNNTINGYYSSNGTTWTALAASANFEAQFVTYQNGNWLIFPYNTNGKYQATNPTGAWTNISGNTILPCIVNYNNNFQSCIDIYDGKFYFIPAFQNNSIIGVWDTNLTGAQSTTIYSPIQFVTQGYTNSSNYSSAYSILVNSTGGILVGAAGRIWSSF